MGEAGEGCRTFLDLFLFYFFSFFPLLCERQHVNQTSCLSQGESVQIKD